MAPRNYDINTEDQLYGPAKVGDTVNPELFKSPKTTFGKQLQSSKAVTDGIRGAFLDPKSTSPFTQSTTGSRSVAGQAPEPTMYGAGYGRNSLDPRHVLPKSILGSIANLFEVSFSGFPIAIGTDLFRERELGLLCSEASLPATSFGTLEVNGHYQGRTEVFAHTRIYPSLTLTFYETLDHKSLMFFEDWQEYITEDGTNQSDPTHYYRMKFPNDYKCDSIYITKFEKSYRGFGYSNTLTYQFMRAFPKNVTSVPVAYGQSEFTKVTVEFAYDRYIVNPQEKKAETNPGYIPEAPSQELVREEPPTQPPTKVVPADSIEEPIVYDVNPTPTPGIIPPDPELDIFLDPEEPTPDLSFNQLAQKEAREHNLKHRSEIDAALPPVPGASPMYAARVRAANNPDNLPGKFVIVNEAQWRKDQEAFPLFDGGGPLPLLNKERSDKTLGTVYEVPYYYKFVPDVVPAAGPKRPL